MSGGLATKRKVGQGVLIDGGRIHVVVAEICGRNEVKLRIKAPEDVLILRDEVATDPNRVLHYTQRVPRPADALEGALNDLFSQRQERLEMMAAKFVQEVGPAEAQDYELVEVREGDTTRWFFRAKGAGGVR